MGKRKSELDKYPRYGYDGERKCVYYNDLDVALCPRCKAQDMIPGQRVCNSCRAEIQADECDEGAYIYEMEHF